MIDTHQHYWKVSRGGYAWMPTNNSILYRDYVPSDLKPICKKHNISATIAIQADDNEAETEFLLSVATKEKSLVGVVGWVDLASSTAAARIHAFANNRYFLGIRPMIQDIAALDWMLKPELSGGIQQLIKLDLTFDALIMQKHLPYFLHFLKKYPRLRVVVNHFAKPIIAKKHFNEWAIYMRTIASYPYTYCKLSGLLTEAGDHKDYTTLAPYIEHLVHTFGHERLLFGSDWPVVNLAGDYSAWLHILQRFFQNDPLLLHQKIGVENAKKAYPKISLNIV